MALFDRSLFAIGCSALATISGSAHATWSILIADMRTGEIVIGSATCVESIDLQHSTPVLISGVGAVTAQSAVDTSGMNRQIIRDRLLQGVPLDAVLDELSISDGGHNNRQYGMINVYGDTLTYSGVQNAAWAGGQTGQIERGIPGPQEDIVYAVQGNILSGSNVVQAAIDAINASSGDLPQMMMEAMQAAKVAGGDGRCSCSNADPTGCGSPPPEPFKSAHVGYMLGTRAGDTDAVRAIYPIDGFVGDLETIDLDGDGFEEVVVGNRDNNELSIYINTAAPGIPLSSLQLWETLSSSASETVAMGVGDFDNDGENELAIAYANPPRLSIYESDGKGGLEQPPTSFDLPGIPADLRIGDLVSGSEDIAVSIADSQAVRFYGLQDGMYGYLGELSLGFTPAGIEITDLLGGNEQDLAITDPNTNAVHIFEHTGGLGFQSPVSITTLAGPANVRGADIDLDGRNELLVQSAAGRRVQVFREDNDTWAQIASLNCGGVGIGFEVAPINPDDPYPDIITTAAATNRNMWLYRGDGQGGFVLQTRTRVGTAARSISLTDMNNNGEVDIVVGNAGNEGLVVLDNSRDIDLPQPGFFAEGDYFLLLNVPNQRAGDPDPVDQLQDQYDAWLLTRAGRVDAIRSSVAGRSVLTTNSMSTMTIELRDLNGDLLDITDPGMLEASIEGGLVSVMDPINIEPGVFTLSISSSAGTGQSSLRISAGEAGDLTQLMPSIEISVSENIADFNADGICSFFDVTAFIAAFLIENPNADFTGDGAWDFHDVSAFLAEYNACTGG